jgi:hypothetical protein
LPKHRGPSRRLKWRSLSLLAEPVTIHCEEDSTREMNRWWEHVRIHGRHLVTRESRAKTIESDGRVMKIIGVPSRKIDNFGPEMIETKRTSFCVSSVQAA